MVASTKAVRACGIRSPPVARPLANMTCVLVYETIL